MFGDKMTSERPFEYTIDRVRTRFSKPEIVESLKRFAKVYGVETFGMREYDAWDQHILSAERIRVRFHGWGKALQAAGLRAQRSSLNLKEMVSAFKACWRQYMSVPSRRQLEAYLEQNNFPFRWKSYMNVWGGLQSLAKLVVDVERGRVPESMLYLRVTAVNTRRPISLKDRTAVLKRDKYRCVKCGASSKVDNNVRLEVDHIVPVAKGGANNLHNFQTLCFECNQGKKDGED